MQITERQKKRFWQRVSKASGCWSWGGSHNGDGYGQVWAAGKMRKAHRVMFFLSFGKLPKAVRHDCDNPGCLNPTHLLAGTQLDNIADRERRGRGSKGVSRPVAKVDPQKVREIRRLRPTTTLAKLAEKFDVSTATVCHVVSRRRWGHVA